MPGITRPFEPSFIPAWQSSFIFYNDMAMSGIYVKRHVYHKLPYEKVKGHNASNAVQILYYTTYILHVASCIFMMLDRF